MGRFGKRPRSALLLGNEWRAGWMDAIHSLCAFSSVQMVHELELYNTEYYLGMFLNSFAVFQVCIVGLTSEQVLVSFQTPL